MNQDENLHMGFLDKMLSDSFSEFWLRAESASLSTLNQFSLEKIGIDYFIALDQAIGKKGISPLCELLDKKIEPPREFLPILSSLMMGAVNKMGQPSKFTHGERQYIYLRMCEIFYKQGVKNESELFDKIAQEILSPDQEVSIKSIARIWSEFKEEKRIKSHFLSGT